jgi:hypothetical protein
MQWLAELSIKRRSSRRCSCCRSWSSARSRISARRRPVPQGRLPERLDHHAQTGAAPEEIETDITDKIERAVNTIAGIDEMRSVSTEGVSQVFIQFKLEKNIDVAQQEVQPRSTRSCPICRATSTSRSSTRSIRRRRRSVRRGVGEPADPRDQRVRGQDRAT